MNVLVSIILLGLLFWKLKNNFVNRVTLSYEYKIKELSFKLDMLVVSNKVKIDNYKYKSLRVKIFSIGNKLKCLNLIVLLIYFLLDKKNNSKSSIKKTSNSSISKKDQRTETELGKIEKELNDTLFEYIIKKNVGLKILLIAIQLGIAPVKRMANKISARLREYLKYYIEKPLHSQSLLSPFTT